MVDGDNEFENFDLLLFFIYIDGRNILMLFDFLLMEEECVLLEYCMIGLFWWFFDLLSVCLIFLELLVDSLIKDFEDMDFDYD